VPDPDPRLLDPLIEWLRIPSVSAGKQNPDALRAAAEWARERVVEAGGQCELHEDGGNPLVLGHLEARRKDAPTVMIYGHYDVQDTSDLSLWTTPPFEPDIRGGRLYARGASDDKGNFWPLLWTTCEMAKANELDVNVRVVVEGEEESGGETLLRWLRADTERTDAAIVFDSGGPLNHAAITLGARGVVAGDVRVTVAGRDLHSGLYGGAVPNAIHVLTRMLEAILPLPNGLLRNELRKHIKPIPEEELSGWDERSADDFIASSGGRLIDPSWSKEFFVRNAFEPSLDVTWIRSGEKRTIVPARASAHVTMRLAPGQRYQAMWSEIERLLRGVAPSNADVETEITGAADAASFDANSPPLVAARRAYERAFGEGPVFLRLGGTIPLLEVLEKRGIQTVVGGFGHASDNIHAPDESYRLEALDLGAKASRALLEEFSTLST
jgi:acetylornithine deacetylase/succinyl-diaminopimelate desuccinylase-like protein